MDKKVKFWQHREKKFVERPFFCPMSQLDIKTDFFQKPLFLNKTFHWAHRMQFWQLGHFFEENQNFMFNLRRWENRKKQKWSFLRKSNFPQKDSGEEVCSFDKPNEKISTKNQLFSLYVRKCKMLKKGIINFSEVFFQQNLPMSK